MKIYSLLDDMLTALANDTELINLSTIWYGQAPEVYIDQDKDNPPGQSSAPAIQLHSPVKRAAEDRRQVHYSFMVAIDINEPDDATRPENNANEFKATARLEEIVTRTIAVIRAAKPVDWVMDFEYETDIVNAFPLFTADILITFTQELVIGQDPLA